MSQVSSAAGAIAWIPQLAVVASLRSLAPHYGSATRPLAAS